MTNPREAISRTGCIAAATQPRVRARYSHRKCRPLKTFIISLTCCLQLLQKISESSEQGAASAKHLQVRNLTQQPSTLIDNGSTLPPIASNSSQTAAQIIEDDMMKLPLYMRTLATLACLIIFTIGVCGNLLVPLVVIKTKYLRNSTNLFLINLSVADLLVLIVCMPIVLIELHSRPETWLLGEPMCKLSNFIEMLAANGSIFTILAISFERYYAICKPLKAGYKCTRLRATVIICLVWLLAFVLTSPILIMAKSSETIYIDGSLVYNCILETATYWHKMYVFVSMIAFFCLPLLVLMLVYWLIGRRLIRENLAMSSTISSHHNQAESCNSSSDSAANCQRSTKLLVAEHEHHQRNNEGIRPSVWKLVALTSWCGISSCNRAANKTSRGSNGSNRLVVGQLLPDQQTNSAAATQPAVCADTQIRLARVKPGKAYSLDHQHLALRKHCSMCQHNKLPTDGVDPSLNGKAAKTRLRSATESSGNVSLINLHKFVSHLFGSQTKSGLNGDTQATLQHIATSTTTTNGIASQTVQVADGSPPRKLCSPQTRFTHKGGSNGFMMQAINEQQGNNGTLLATDETGSEPVSNDELLVGSHAPFLVGGDQQTASRDTSTAAITGSGKQLSLGFSSHATATRPVVSLLRGTLNRRQLVKQDSCGSVVGSKFTRWARKRFSISSSSTASMLTTTTTAATSCTGPPSEVLDCVLTNVEQQQQQRREQEPLDHESGDTLEQPDKCERLVLRSGHPLMVSRQSTEASSSDCAATQAIINDYHRKYSKKRLINAASSELSKQNRAAGEGLMEKCTRFGSVSTTNCSSPIPSSSNISGSSASSPYSSSSKSPSPDSIYAKQHKQLRISGQVQEIRKESKSGLSVKDSGTFSMGGEEDESHHLEKLTKVYDTANNCDTSDGAGRTFMAANDRNQVTPIVSLPNGKSRRNKLMSKSLIVKDDDLNIDSNQMGTRVNKLRQSKDEHKSLDNSHIQHHNNHHFHFNLKRSNKRSGSQPAVCSHHQHNLNIQNGSGAKLSEMLVVQDLSKKQQMDSRRQVVIMLAFVVACFFLLFFPYRVFTIWLILSTEAQVQSLGMETYYNLTYFSRILIYLHSAINPIAYNLISTKFRRAFMSILLCRGSSSRRHFTTEHRIINRRMTVDDHHKSIRQATSNQTR